MATGTCIGSKEVGLGAAGMELEDTFTRCYATPSLQQLKTSSFPLLCSTLSGDNIFGVRISFSTILIYASRVPSPLSVQIVDLLYEIVNTVKVELI